jgi:hypothetical protein
MIDQTYVDDQGGIVMSPINDGVRSDIRIAWPTDPGTSRRAAAGHVRLGPAIAPCHRGHGHRDGSLWVDDPPHHAIAGRVADPVRTLLADFPRRGLSIEVSPDSRWAMTTDRVGDVRLVELASGRSWSIDRERLLAWWPSA